MEVVVSLTLSEMQWKPVVIVDARCDASGLLNELRVAGDGRMLEEIGDDESVCFELELNLISMQELHDEKRVATDDEDARVDGDLLLLENVTPEGMNTEFDVVPRSRCFAIVRDRYRREVREVGWRELLSIYFAVGIQRQSLEYDEHRWDHVRW